MATKPFLSQIAVPVGTTTGDVYYPQTSLLMHFNGTNGSTTMTDSSKNNVSFTVNGNSQISTAQSKFGGASILFDGTGDYLSSPSTSNFAFGTGDFTIECWAYKNSGTNNGILHLSSTAGGLQANSSTNLAIALFSTGTGTFYANNTSYNTSAFTNTTNTWNHYAIVRSNGVTKLYFNGNLVTDIGTSGAITDTTNYTGTYLAIGGYYSTSYLWNGYIDEFRITNGVARYTSNFTPPTAQFLDSAGDANSNVVVNSTATGFAIGTGGINGAQLAKAWVNFNGTGTVAIRDSYNVSSITDNGVGDYTINYGTALNNNNYAISGITDYNESGLHRVIVYRSGLSHQYNTLGVRIQIIGQVGSSDNTQDPVFASLMVLGN
jgi:hypothetical protein